MKIKTIILAAGKGTRMKSSLPKVLHKIGHKTMLEHSICAAQNVGSEDINVIYGHGGKELIEKTKHLPVNFIEQTESLGTGHAVAQAIPHINDDEVVLVLYGDVPLITSETLDKLLKAKRDNGMSLLTVNLQNPTGYGRIIRPTGMVKAIIEEKDATPQERMIKEVNTGILAANGKHLKHWLSMLNNDNAQGEYYLTDIIEMASDQGIHIETAMPRNEIEVMGANDRIQLSQLEREYQRLRAEELMLNGVTLRDPSRIDVRGDVITGEDVEIDVNAIFNGKVVIGNNVTIGANCIITDSVIGDNVIIKPNTIIESSTLMNDSSAGPFARLRPNSFLSEDAHIGNFVETKNTTIGKGTKAGHLTYLGDSVIGEKVNIGAGTVTCNYDGVNKHKTVIDDNSFVGSNSSLVAPLNIGKNVTIAAGSTITNHVKDNALALGRCRQVAKDNWSNPNFFK